MQLNVFRVPAGEAAALKARLAGAGLSVIKQLEQGAWRASFHFSAAPEPTRIPWAETFAGFFPDGELPTNRAHCAAFVFEGEDDCFVCSYGKAHFYIRPYCDHDFGIELAKRIADEDDIRQTAGKRFAGKRRRDIKSYGPQTPLIVEGGESVDFVQASIVEPHRGDYGKTGKFGSSAQVCPEVEIDALGAFFDTVVAELRKPARFSLPRTLVVTDDEEISRLDGLLVDELLSNETVSDFTNNTIDLYGVDFVFPSEGTFRIGLGRTREDLDQLTMGHLKEFIRAHGVARADVLKIKVTHDRESAVPYRTRIKDEIDFIPDGERVVLSGGRWLRFNQDYLAYLDAAIRHIEVEQVEPQLAVVRDKEGDFNASQAVREAGFEPADKNFEILRTRSSTPVEAWDLRRGSTVYAVKFGTAQKLHYVCDQALNVLELLRNRAGTKEIESFERYCLWFGYRAQKLPESLADTGSIILKQKVEAWARKATELGVAPVIRLSRQVGTVDQRRAEQGGQPRQR